MKQSILSKWLKVVIIGAGFCGLVIYLYVFPSWGKNIAFVNPEYSYCYWPWLIFLWITAIPCYAALVCGFIIANEIGKDNSFSIKNANLLKVISMLAAGDSAFFFAGNVVFLLLNMNQTGIILLAFFAVFAGVTVTVVSAALSHLVYKAVQIREENELTI